jgi:CubicO group peptidase (beta-lactamase class C family)
MNRKRALKKIKDPKFLKLCQAAVAEMRRLKIPGCTVGVYYQGQEFITGFGKTSREHPLQVTPKTLFQVGSNTKPMVTTAIMRLVEAGTLNLDATAKSCLPKFKLKDKEATEGVTLLQLLTHTAGFEGDYFNDFGEGDDALQKMVASLSRLNQLTPPGEVWSYNNAAFYTAGYILEIASGKPFRVAMQEFVFEPLGMHMSAFFPDERIVTGRYAVGHDLTKNRVRIARPWTLPRSEDPAGGVLATAHDLLTFARFHMGDGKVDGKRILKAASLRKMQKPVVRASDVYQMGLSWFLSDFEGLKVVSHGGATNGQRSGLWFVPEEQFALTWLTNSSETNTDVLLEDALKIFFNLSKAKPKVLDIDAQKIQEYLGHYENIEMVLTVSEKKGKLRLSFKHKGGFPTPDSPPMPVPDPARIGFYEEGKFIVLKGAMAGERGEFMRTTDGNLVWLRFSGRIHRKSE